MPVILINFRIVVFVIVILTFENKLFHCILKSKTNDRM
ncbi:putative membrane protein [Escherichia coli TW00353]|nr:putative membrane protein [Escherichia coli TW00353]